jgi:hypothetical protein
MYLSAWGKGAKANEAIDPLMISSLVFFSAVQQALPELLI